MWFNILKIEDRRAAYRLFINSMVHLGELILPKPPTEVVNEGGVRSLVAETPNGHFEWGQEFNFDGTFGKFYLASVPYNYEAHTDYIEGMFEQEYPEQYAALRKFFRENAYATEEKEDDSPSSEKKLISKIMEDWAGYMDNINSFIIDNLGNPELTLVILDDINTKITYKRVKFFTEIYEKEKDNFILAILHGIQQTYASKIKSKNPDIILESIIRFIIHFREEYTQHLFITAKNRNYTQEDAVQDVTYTQMRNLARNIWRNNPNDVETLMRQLPNYN